jgi:molybdopterin converting factor small subunit
VRLFATLRRCLDGVAVGAATEVELPDGATVADLLAMLGVPLAEAKVAFVNGRARPMEWPLQPGDEVGIFPPIGGG